MSTSAHAEGLLDVYVGGAFTGDSVVGNATADWQDSVAVGARGGYWLGGNFKWLGLAADVSWYRPRLDDGSTGVNLVPLTPMILLRLPLMKRQEHPGGILQPYVAGGPGLFFATLSRTGSPREFDFTVGPDVRAGVAVQLIPHVGVFIEYRYTNAKVSFANSDHSGTELRTNHFNAGMAMRF